MLDAPELAKRLRAAMDQREPKLQSIYLAEQCGVTKQAVHGWRKHGRIAKRHLQAIARITEKPLEFFLEPERGESKETRTAWKIIGQNFAKAALLLIALLTIPPSPAQAQSIVDMTRVCIMLNRRFRIYWRPSHIMIF